MQVLFGTVLVDAFHPALEHRIVAFDGIGMHDPANVFPGAVARGVMFGEVLVQLRILAGFIGHDVGAGRNVRLDDWQQVLVFGADQQRVAAEAFEVLLDFHLYIVAGEVGAQGFVVA